MTARAIRSQPCRQARLARTCKSCWATKVKAGDITSFSTSNVKSGTNTEIFVLFALWSLSEKSRWGTETDIVTAMRLAGEAG